MAGIGEASAIIGVVQVGFSLATALNTYISDVSDAADDISSLVSDIEATFGQLRDLAKLIEKNVTTKAWSEDGLRNAQKCVENCEKVIKKLRKLLKKSTASATTEEVGRDEIDVSKLERALWPFIKPQLEVRRKELQSIKQDIVIAYSSYMTQVGTDAERQKFTDDLPRLQRTRALARKQVLQAKEQRRKYGSTRQRRPQPGRSAQVFPDSGLLADDEILSRAQPYKGALSDDGRDLFPDEDGPFVYDYFDDLERDFELWKTEQDERKAKEEAQTKRVQEEAIEAWRRRQLQEVETIRKKTEENRSALRAELTRQQIAPQQINDVVNHVYPQEPVNIDLHLSNLTPATNSTPSVVSGDGRSSSSNSRRWSIWSKKKSSSDQGLSSATTAVEDTRETPVPKLLRDPTAEGGIARLEATYWQRSEGAPTRVQHFDVEIPGQWLLNALIKREEAVAQDSRKVNPVWKEFSQLPNDYRYAIGEHVEYKKDYGVNSWVLLHLDCMPGKHRHSILNRNGRGELVGVYVVLKENRKPKSQIPANGEEEIEYGVKEARAKGELGSADHLPSSLARRRNRSGYIPRHVSRGSAASRPALRDHRVTRDYESEDGGVGITHWVPEREEERYTRRSFVEPSSDYPSNRRRNVAFEREETEVRSPRRSNRDYEHRYDDRSAATILPIPRRERSRSRSRNRSPSPRPLRRSGTDESYRSSGSATAGRELFTRRYGESEREVIIPKGKRDLQQLSRLSDIQERSENASITSSSDESEDELQETDKELLEKTLNEYVNRGSDPPKPSVDDEREEG